MNGIYAAVGLLIFAALRIVDVLQTVMRLQPAKRPLSDDERALLRPVFGGSLDYDRIEIVDGRAGLLGVSGRALAMGFTIYMPAPRDDTLVHECVHVWQFQFGGFGYIGNSALRQLAGLLAGGRYNPYAWRAAVDAGASWRTLASVEAQAQLIQDVFTGGEFVPDDVAAPVDRAPGAFFRDGPQDGINRFVRGAKDYTAVANDAWQALRRAGGRPG